MMTESCSSLPIGVFDSGIGGISVLAELIYCLPEEGYVYYGDSVNAPYGVRNKDEIKELSFQVTNHLMKYGIKGLVVACNTASSAAVNELREAFNIPIVAMEPALKPAVELQNTGKIIVMATPLTLMEKKFNSLSNRLNNNTEIIKLPCPGLVEMIEEDGGKGPELKEYLEALLLPFKKDDRNVIVLGCTHYIFVKDIIREIAGEQACLIDGNRGTARQLERLLKQYQILRSCNKEEKGYTEVKILNSANENNKLALSKTLLEKHLNLLEWKGQLKYLR
jgi:glutamate racemase